MEFETFNDIPFSKGNAEGVESTSIDITQSPGEWIKLT